MPVSYPPQAKWQVEEFAPSDQVTAQMPQPNAAHSSSLPLTLCLLRFLFLDRRRPRGQKLSRNQAPRPSCGQGAMLPVVTRLVRPRQNFPEARSTKHFKESDYARSYVWQQHFNFAFRRLNSCSSPRAESGSGVKLRLAQRRCRGAESIKSSLVLWCRRGKECPATLTGYALCVKTATLMGQKLSASISPNFFRPQRSITLDGHVMSTPSLFMRADRQ